MGRRLATLLAAAALGLSGCGGTGTRPLSALCTEGPQAIAQALRSAPAPVHMSDGSRLSDCVTRAQDAGSLQDFGIVVTRLADSLAERAATQPAVAAQLGYLVGATRRGAAVTNGISLELAHRLESSVRRMGDPGPGVTAALARGLRAGERTG